MLEKKKPSRKSRAVVDVPADNPEGTMDRFTDGLKRVVNAHPKRIRESRQSDQKRNT